MALRSRCLKGGQVLYSDWKQILVTLLSVSRYSFSEETGSQTCSSSYSTLRQLGHAGSLPHVLLREIAPRSVTCAACLLWPPRAQIPT